METENLKLLHDLADREAIRELMYRYGRGVDSANLEAVLAVFDDPCTVIIQPFGHPARRFEGRKAVEEFFTHRAAHNAPAKLLRHRYKNPLIEVNGDHAGASVYWDEIREQNNEILLAGGTYFDQLRRTAQGWRFSERFIRSAYTLRLMKNAAEAVAAGDLMFGVR